MRDQEIIGLWEAYQQVHIQEEVEQIDENDNKKKQPSAAEKAGAAGIAAGVFGAATAPESRHQRKIMRSNRPSGRLGNSGTSSGKILPLSASERSGLPASFRPSARGGAGSGSFTADEYDFYDIILSHLLDEGYADTNKAALAIMANMSEEWLKSIVESMDPDSPGNKHSYGDAVRANQKAKEMREKHGKDWWKMLPRTQVKDA